MLVYDQTFSTVALNKPGEPTVAVGQVGRVGESVLARLTPSYWTGQFHQPYDTAAVARWRELCGKDRFGQLDFENVQHTVTQAATLRIIQAAAADGFRVSTYGLYAGIRQTRTRDGAKYGLNNWARANVSRDAYERSMNTQIVMEREGGVRVLSDDEIANGGADPFVTEMILRRLEQQKAALELMAYIHVEFEHAPDSPYIDLYLKDFTNVTRTIRARFPHKRILTEIGESAAGMSKSDLFRYLDRAAAFDADVVLWGAWDKQKPTYEAAVEWLEAHP